MIYSNVNLKSEERELEFGTIHQLYLGQFGRGRKAVVMTTPGPIEIKAKAMTELTVGTTKSGKPRINKGKDGIFLFLDSYGGYSRRGNGVIFYLKSEKDNFKVLGEGNGADGDAGRIGWWQVAAIEIKAQPCTFLVSYSGSEGKEEWVLVNHDKVVMADETCLDEVMEAMGIDEVPRYEYSSDKDFADMNLARL